MSVSTKSFPKQDRFENVEIAADALNALNHGLRQRAIELLEEHGSLTVTDLYVKMRLEQSVASQHLAIMRRAGLLKTERNGKFIYYSVKKDVLDNALKSANQLAGK